MDSTTASTKPSDDEISRGDLHLEHLSCHGRPHLSLGGQVVETLVDSASRVFEDQRLTADAQRQLRRTDGRRHGARAHWSPRPENRKLASGRIELETERARLETASDPGVVVSNLEKPLGGGAPGRLRLAAEREGKTLPKTLGREPRFELRRKQRPVQLGEMSPDPICRDSARTEVRMAEHRLQKRKVGPRTVHHHDLETGGEPRRSPPHASRPTQSLSRSGNRSPGGYESLRRLRNRLADPDLRARGSGALGPGSEGIRSGDLRRGPALRSPTVPAPRSGFSAILRGRRRAERRRESTP